MAVPGAEPGGIERYWAEVVRRRTRNGIVCISLFGSQLRLLERLMRPGLSPVYVYLHRRDIAEQVASLLALYQTKMPYHGEAIVPDLPGIGEVSDRAVRVLAKWIGLQNDKWRGFLNDLPHLAVASEDFLADPAATLRAVLDLGQWEAAPGALEAVAARLSGAGSYSVNAAIKAQLKRDLAPAFAALRAGASA
jgi:LPS sulfotransferase NodH